MKVKASPIQPNKWGIVNPFEDPNIFRSYNVAAGDIPRTLLGTRIVITGKLESGSRRGLQNKVREQGGYPQQAVSRRTDLLVVGDNPGSKLDMAIRFNIPVAHEDEFIDLLDGHPADRDPPVGRLIYRERSGDGSPPSGFCSHNHRSLKRAIFCPNRAVSHRDSQYREGYTGYRIMAIEKGAGGWRNLTDGELAAVTVLVDERRAFWAKYFGNDLPVGDEIQS